MIISVDLKEKSYNIFLKRNALKEIDKYLNLSRKVLIVTDSGVPKEYAETVKEKCSQGHIITIPMGEESKNLNNFSSLLEEMCKLGFTRSDCVVAVGGGVVGDLAGFVAASFMRGVDFYNIPTTVLSQVDSSIGGKVAIDFAGFKNIVGAFYQPKAVVIDPETLKTLPSRQISNGLAEALKMSLTSDKDLFELIEKEAGLRKILNFGHTIGHAIEVNSEYELYHGECVALGMIPMCNDNIKPRVLKTLEKLNLPITHNFSADELADAIKHDKKMSGDKITVVFVENIGEFSMKTYEYNDFINILKGEK